MKLGDLIERIEAEVPREQALEWDNVGLLVGDRSQEIQKIYIALDLTDEVLLRAKEVGADLILTHHPLIFHGIKTVTTDDFIGRRVYTLAHEGMSYYAMHTNFDVCVMGRIAAEKLPLTNLSVLEVTGKDADQTIGIGSVGDLTEAESIADFAERVRDAFGLSHVRVFGDPKIKVRRVAMCPGSGKSDIAEALISGAQVYVTGDIDHHSGIDANAQGLAIIDAGHYGIEHIYIDYMKEWLKEYAPELSVVTDPFSEPYWIVT